MVSFSSIARVRPQHITEALLIKPIDTGAVNYFTADVTREEDDERPGQSNRRSPRGELGEAEPGQTERGADAARGGAGEIVGSAARGATNPSDPNGSGSTLNIWLTALLLVS